MGYSSNYRVYDKEGKLIGTFSGWTANDAIKSAVKHSPKIEKNTGLTAKYLGENCPKP